jgi:ABC-2 type transport system permease protein
MTAITTLTRPTIGPPARPRPEAINQAPLGGHRALDLAKTFRAEWTKLRTLRSTWWTIGGSAFVSIGLAAVICAAQVSQWDQMTAKQRLTFDPTSTTLIGVLFATVILGSLAVRAMTGEYSSGMIRVTFSALPRRRSVLAAKAAILAVVVFPVALASNLVAFLVGSQILASKHAGASLGQPGVIRAIIFGALAVSLVAVVGLGLGGIIRRTAGATTALSLGIIGTQIFGLALPAGFRQYLPGSAIQALLTVNHSSGLLAPVTALAVMAGYAAVAFGIASTMVARRDA